MSHKSGNRKYEDNEGSGPRPPVPGEESRAKKMTEGVADISRRSPPSYLNWARTLNHLLEDSDGVNLFVKYVAEDMPEYNDHLDFYFVCEGLKQKTDAEEIQKLIHAIYKRFIREGNILVSKELRDTLKASRKNKIPLSPNIYDAVQQNVEITIRDKIYPSFLCSEMYIAYIQRMSAADERCSSLTAGSGSGGSSSSGASCVSGGAGGAGGGIASSYAIGSGMGACALPSNTMTTKLYNNPTSPFVLPTCSSSSSINEGRFAERGAGGVSYPPPPITAAGACSASGSVYGPSTSASSSGSISATDTLPRSSTLPTLHEDTELVCDDLKKLRMESGSGSGSHQSAAAAAAAADMPQQRLTREMLLATQTRRLDVRPSGAHGYNYKPKANSSYVPNSCVDSERASVSSGGRTDSDTMSLSSCSMDGRPYRQRREKSDHGAIRQSAMLNKETNHEKVIPRTQQRSIPPSLPKEKFAAELILRLELLKAKLDANDENDDHILEDHISRVWPGRSPGTISPRPPLPHRRTTVAAAATTTAHDSGMLSDGAMSGHSMKHSKSMPDHSSSSRKLINKWPSMNTDSGISLFSSDNSMKCQASSSRSGLSTTSKLEEAKRRLEEEPRPRPRRSAHQMLTPQQQQQQQQQLLQTSLASHGANAGAAAAIATFSSSSSGSSTLHSHALPPLPLPPPTMMSSVTLPLQPPPPLPAKPHEPSTVVIYTFCDETVPFKATIPGTQPTLKQFKDCLPKKGNFKFYFQTHYDDPVVQKKILIQEEIKCDSDVLPLLDGKVRGQVMPSD